MALSFKKCIFMLFTFISEPFPLQNLVKLLSLH